MTFTELQNQVQILLGDVTTDFFTSTELENSVNRTLPILAQSIEELLTFKDFTTAAGTQRYSMEEDFLKLKHIFLKVDTDLWEKLIELDLEQFHNASYGATTQQSIPVYYKQELGATVTTDDPQIPGDIWLYPIPDANGSSNYTLRMYYFQKPTELSSGGDIPEFPDHMHMAIAYHAAMILAIKNSDFQRANFLEAKYRFELVEIKNHYARKNRDRSRVVKDAMNYGGEFFD